MNTTDSRGNERHHAVDRLAITAIAVSILVLIGGITFTVLGLIVGRTDGRILLGVVLLLGGAIALAWGVGRLRRLASLTPDAVIDPGADPER